MDKLLDRIAALLAKADSTDSEHEAAALVSKAQQLATLHAVDLAVARQRGERARRREGLEQRKVVLARRGESGRRHRVLLFCAVARSNDVRVDVAHDSTYVIGYGYGSDLDVVDALYASLAAQMVAASSGAIARGEHRNDTYWSESAGAWRSDARVYRSAFHDAFISEVARRLAEARSEALAHVVVPAGVASVAADARETSAGALVLRGKAADVEDFHRTTSTARGTWRGRRAADAAFSPAGYEAGGEAGRRARLSGQRALAGARAAVADGVSPPPGLPRGSPP